MKKHFRVFSVFVLCMICIFGLLNIKGDEYMVKKISDIGNKYIDVKSKGAVGDGVTDDTKAVSEAVKLAYSQSKAVYFPKGEYLISETVSLPKDDSKILSMIGDGESRIIGSALLDGDIFHIDMKYNLYVSGLSFKHMGRSGSCINASYLKLNNCDFEGNADNTSSLVVFKGSDSRVTACKFNTLNSESFSVYYALRDGSISINDYITDNSFSGIGCGITVGDGEYTIGGRCEGLKINGNTFTNTGAVQILLQEILHVDVSDNSMSGAENAIVITQKGHGVDGTYIGNNNISAVNAGVLLKGEKGTYISTTNICDNCFDGAAYGVRDEIGGVRVTVARCGFKNISNTAIYARNTDILYITDNTILAERAIDADTTKYKVIRDNKMN